MEDPVKPLPAAAAMQPGRETRELEPRPPVFQAPPREGTRGGISNVFPGISKKQPTLQQTPGITFNFLRFKQLRNVTGPSFVLYCGDFSLSRFDKRLIVI